VLQGKLVENRLRLVLAPEDPQAARALELRLRDGVAGWIPARDAFEELQRRRAVPADLADQAGQIQGVVRGAVPRISGDEGQQLGLRLRVVPFVELLDGFR